jgi:putative hemolysin
MEEQPLQDQQIESNLQSSPSPPAQPAGDTRKSETIKEMRLSLISLVVVVVIIGGYFAYKTFSVKPVINSYEECVEAKGSFIQESYPPVCVTKGGLRFTSNEVTPVTPVPLPLTKAEECYEQVTNSNCPEGTVCENSAMMANPASLFCICMGGSLEIREKTEGQYGVCTINGEEYDEWEYFEMMSPKNGASGTPEYLLEKSEGSCVDDMQCKWAGEGCGGGHGVCTNDPEKYKDIVTTCDVDETFPANRGYTCGCIETLSKCGWKK